MTLACGRFTYSLSRPLIMGIVNVTPDSFSDGGLFYSPQLAIEQGLRLVEEGADILDIGGESTRPGAARVGEAEELARVMPVLEGLMQAGVALSIDTQKPAVMRAALAAGVDMVNDIHALQQPGALAALAGSKAAVCLMHKQGDPQTMLQLPLYHDVVAEVHDFLQARIQAAQAAGIASERLIIDPGFGFGKNLEHNVALLQNLQGLQDLEVPVLVGLSRKSMLGKIANREVHERVHVSVAAAILAALRGAKIIRVHDVQATRDALAIVNVVEEWHE